jgi:hypothetical protein
MTRRSRRIGARAAVGLAALFVVGSYASPAYADTTADLEIKFVGTTIAPGTDEKFGSVSIINHGPGDASGITVTFDISALDTDKIEFEGPGDCTGTGPIVCEFPSGLVVKNGEDFDTGVFLTKKTGATGDAGQLTASLSHDGTDPTSSNNSATTDVTISDVPGPDLGALALDVYQDTDDAPGEPGANLPIAPGGTSNLYVFVVNQGDIAANGVRITIKLPEHVSFNEAEPDCTHAVGDATTTCEYETVVLTTAGTDDSLEIFFFPVKVADDATGPAALTDGVVVVESMNLQPPPPALTAQSRPRNLVQDVPEGLLDVDPTDNTDEFAVFVAGPDLPVTGARAGVIGAAGAALVLLGVVLVMVVRRRRPAAVHPDR